MSNKSNETPTKTQTFFQGGRGFKGSPLTKFSKLRLVRRDCALPEPVVNVNDPKDKEHFLSIELYMYQPNHEYKLRLYEQSPKSVNFARGLIGNIDVTALGLFASTHHENNFLDVLSSEAYEVSEALFYNPYWSRDADYERIKISELIEFPDRTKANELHTIRLNFEVYNVCEPVSKDPVSFYDIEFEGIILNGVRVPHMMEGYYDMIEVIRDTTSFGEGTRELANQEKLVLELTEWVFGNDLINRLSNQFTA